MLNPEPDSLGFQLESRHPNLFMIRGLANDCSVCASILKSWFNLLLIEQREHKKKKMMPCASFF